MLGDLRTEMTYDYMGRRVRKLVLELVDGEGPPTGSNPWGGNDGMVVDDMRYIYDGWNVVIERRVTDRTTVGEYPETAVRKYAWGLDLSGLNGAAATSPDRQGAGVSSAVHGAGGIGGLLAIEDFTTQIGYENSRACIYFYDGNGNVGQLVTWKTGDPELVEEPGQLPWTPFNLPGTIVERYEYDPYGGTLLADDNYAVDNPFRFSTKYYDAQPSTAAAGERGLYYYGYRYYSPRLGRWVNRDPIGEVADDNLLQSFDNNAIQYVDYLGLSPGAPSTQPNTSSVKVDTQFCADWVAQDGTKINIQDILKKNMGETCAQLEKALSQLQSAQADKVALEKCINTPTGVSPRTIDQIKAGIVPIAVTIAEIEQRLKDMIDSACKNTPRKFICVCNTCSDTPNYHFCTSTSKIFGSPTAPVMFTPKPFKGQPIYICTCNISDPRVDLTPSDLIHELNRWWSGDDIGTWDQIIGAGGSLNGCLARHAPKPVP